MSEPVQVPLILRGNLRVGTNDTTAVAVGNEITDFTVSATADIITIPATMNNPVGYRGGAAHFEIKIGYLSTDGTDGVFFPMIWAAIASPTGNKQLYFEGCLRDAVISASNPLWTGTFIVSGANVGGTVQTVSVDSLTFPLIGAPVIQTADSDSHIAFS
jgi:hypothetical protein